MATTTKRIHDINQIGDYFRDLLVSEINRLTKSCLTCEHFSETKEGCRLAEYRRPPARIIAYGCDKWEEQIPF